MNETSDSTIPINPYRGTFNRDALRPGLIVHTRAVHHVMGKMIRRVLSRPYVKIGFPPCWGNHDAILLVRNSPVSEWGTGDSRPRRARFTPLNELQADMASGKTEVRVFEVIGATSDEELAAAAFWMANIQGRLYDSFAFPKLLWKGLMAPMCERAAGMKWAWFCTEGVRDSYWHGIGRDPWRNRAPTPLTTEKRAGLMGIAHEHVTLREITGQVLIPLRTETEGK